MAQADQKLTAVLQATENVSDALDDITSALSKTVAGAEGAEDALSDAQEATAKLSASLAATNPQIQDEAEGLMTLSAAARKAKEAKNAVAISNQQLAAAARKSGSDINEETRAILSLAAGANSTEDFLADLAAMGFATADQMDELEEEFKDVAIASYHADAAIAKSAGVLSTYKSVVDETEDEVRDLSDALDGFSLSTLKASLNLGPFSIALRNLFVTLPQLITLTGALTSAMFGLASAALAAGAALGAVFAGGILAMASSMAAQSSEIKDQFEAIQKIMERIGKAFSRALAPLKNPQSVQMFIDAINGALIAVNKVAKSIRSVQDELSKFQSKIGASFFQNFGEVLDQMEKTFLQLSPLLADFFDWFMRKIPSALAWFREQAKSLAPVLASFGRSLISFFAAFSELGAAILQGVLPVIQGTLKAIEWVADAINMLPNSLIIAISALIAFIYIVRRTKQAFEGLKDIYSDFMKWLKNDAWQKAEKSVQTFDTQVEKLWNTLTGVYEMREDVELAMDQIQTEFAESTRVASVFGNEVEEVQKRLESIEGHGMAEGIQQGFKQPDGAISKPLGRLKKEDKLEMRKPEVNLHDVLEDRRSAQEKLNDVAGAEQVVSEETESLGEAFSTLLGPLMYLIDKFGGLKSLLGKLASKATFLSGAIGYLTTNITGLGTAITSLSISGILSSISGAIMTLVGAISTLVSGLSFSGILGSIATAVMTVVGAVGTLVSILGTGGAVAVIIGAIALISGLAAAFGHTKAVMDAVGQTMDFLGHLLAAFVNPVFNVLIDLAELLLSPFLAIYDGLLKIADALGLVWIAKTLFGAIGNILLWVADVWAGFWGIFGGALDLAADLIYEAFILPFDIVAAIIDGLVWVIQGVIHWIVVLGEEIVNAMGLGGSWIMWLKNVWDWAVGGMSDVWGGFLSFIESGINGLIGHINNLIGSLNTIPGVDIKKFDNFSFKGKGKASETLKEHKKESGKKHIAKGRKIVNKYQTTNEYNFGNFNMLPKEKARVKGLVKQALTEANRNKRLEGGHIG